MYKKIPEKLVFDNKSSILKDKTKERQTGLEPAEICLKPLIFQRFIFFV